MVDAVETIEVEASGNEGSSFPAMFTLSDFFRIDFGLDGIFGVACMISAALGSCSDELLVASIPLLVTVLANDSRTADEGVDEGAWRTIPLRERRGLSASPTLTPPARYQRGSNLLQRPALAPRPYLPRLAVFPAAGRLLLGRRVARLRNSFKSSFHRLFTCLEQAIHRILLP